MSDRILSNPQYARFDREQRSWATIGLAALEFAFVVAILVLLARKRLVGVALALLVTGYGLIGLFRGEVFGGVVSAIGFVLAVAAATTLRKRG